MARIASLEDTVLALAEALRLRPAVPRTPGARSRSACMCPVMPVAPLHAAHSHSMVPGGLLVMSSATRLTSRTSLVIRVEIRASTS